MEIEHYTVGEKIYCFYPSEKFEHYTKQWIFGKLCPCNAKDTLCNIPQKNYTITIWESPTNLKKYAVFSQQIIENSPFYWRISYNSLQSFYDICKDEDAYIIFWNNNNDVFKGYSLVPVKELRTISKQLIDMHSAGKKTVKDTAQEFENMKNTVENQRRDIAIQGKLLYFFGCTIIGLLVYIKYKC